MPRPSPKPSGVKAVASKPAATPLPWKTGRWKSGETDSSIFGGGCFIATIATSAADPGENEANAALIVRAVNSHAALVQALQELLAQDETMMAHLERHGMPTGDFHQRTRIQQKAREALKLAGQGE